MNALLRIPVSIRFTDFNDLTNMIGVMDVDIPEHRIPWVMAVLMRWTLEHCIIRFFNRTCPLCQHTIKLLFCLFPVLLVFTLKRLVIAFYFFRRWISLKPAQITLVPKDKVIHDLPDRVAVSRLFVRLLCRQTIQCPFDWNKPVWLIMIGFFLVLTREVLLLMGVAFPVLIIILLKNSKKKDNP